MRIQDYLDRLLGRDEAGRYKVVLKATAHLHASHAVRDKNHHKDAVFLERATRSSLHNARTAVVEDKKYLHQLSNRPYVISIPQEYSRFLQLAYTWGVSLDQLRELIPEILSALDYAGEQYEKVYWGDEHKVILNYRVHYQVALAYLSILIGLRASHEQLLRFLPYTGPGGADLLFDRVAQHVDTQRSCGTELRFGKHYGLLVQAMDAPAAEQPAIIKKYLDGWYAKVFLRNGGYPTHEGAAYYGYWSWEASAVVMLCNVDDSTFRDHVNYPDELVDYYRRQL